MTYPTVAPDAPAQPAAFRFIFVGGVHRSGTTLVADAIAEHPDVSGLCDTGVPEDEGQHLQDVYPAAHALGGFGRFGFSPAAHMTEAAAPRVANARNRLFDAWRPYWDVSKPLLLEKSPPNVMKTRFLQALFPESYFVVVLRHPLAVAYATHRILGPTARLDLHSHIEHWLRCYETLAADLPHLRAGRLVRYESFVTAPDRALSEIHRTLGLTRFETSVAVHPGLNDAYFRRWRRGRTNPLKRLYARYLVRRFESRLQRFGYSLIDLDALGTAGVPGFGSSMPQG